MSLNMTSMGANAGWLGNHSIQSNSTAYTQPTPWPVNATAEVINQFKTHAVSSERQTTIILAAFNIVVAGATAAGILYDGYLHERRSPFRKRERVNIFSCVRAADVYPLIITLSVVGQGILFAVAQSQGIGTIFKRGCALISEFMLPGLFFVPYVQLIFALETTSRALRKTPFTPRNRWTVTICLILVNIALIITGLVAFFIRAPNVCFASLLWFVARWAEGEFVLLLIIVVVLTSCATIIFLQLKRQPSIRPEDRVGASRMFYYIVLGIFTNVLIIPFFAYLSFMDHFSGSSWIGFTFSEIATITANVSGLLNGGLYLFLRSDIIPTIMAKGQLGIYENQDLKHEDKYQEPNGADFSSHIEKPVSTPRELEGNDARHKVSFSEQRIQSDMNPLRQHGISDKKFVTKAMESVTVPPSSKLHSRKPSSSASYALFPSRDQGKTASTALLPSTTYKPNTYEQPPSDFFDNLKPPPTLHPPHPHHRRDSSWVSSATVQIGLRLSSMDDVPPLSRNFAADNDKVHALGCPDVLGSTTSNRPSPVATLQSRVPQPPRSRFAVDPSPISPLKTLPPLPLNSSQGGSRASVLNPTVYTPNSPIRGRVPSPKGVGFSVPKRSNTEPLDREGDAVPESRGRGYSDAATNNKGDWI